MVEGQPLTTGDQIYGDTEELALPPAAAVKITSPELDVTVHWHIPPDSSPKYLVIDIDNESDDDSTRMRVYRNDAEIYKEGIR